MQLNEISEDRASARQAFLDYRAAFRQYGMEIDRDLMRGYKELAAGRTLIRLHDTIQAGGVDDLGRPKLAIARADEDRIGFIRTMHGAVTFTPNIEWQDRARSADRVIVLGDGTLPAMAATEAGSWVGLGEWAAVTPVIPPRFRPPYDLSGYHLLWEALWTKPRIRRSPVDPALLKRIRGDVFAVLATWDLTPLERAVLELQ